MATFTPRGNEDKGWLGNQLDAFAHMNELGCDVFESAIAAISGHKMTPELAALCIATYWRRYTAICNFQESRGAAITLQAALRGMDQRLYTRQLLDQVRSQHSLAAEEHQLHSDEDNLEYLSATHLQAAWRAHLARQFVDKLRYSKMTRLQRTFSWSKKKKGGKAGAKGGGGIKERSAKDILAGANDVPKKTVKRSMSFDRFTKGVKSIVSSSKDGADSEPKMPANAKQLLFILLQRGSNGLGLELDATNTVVNMVPGGAAASQGYFREGDTIASVDGIPLRGRLLQDVMDRSKNSYSFDVWRLQPVQEPEPTQKALNPVRRAFSFDRKRR